MEPGQHGLYIRFLVLIDFLRPLMLRKDEYLGEVFVSGFNMSAISGTPLMRILVLPWCPGTGRRRAHFPPCSRTW